MFSERLEKLIQSSLQDGILTDQEKTAIIKRAKAEGEDIDEVEIYIDSLLQKRQKELNNSAVNKQANASNMDELKKLIDAAMTDGVLTDKERQVILKKAEGMGLDRDEVDLYLDAEEQKIDQATDAAVRKQKGKTCPYCGSPVPQLADKCPACNQFITPEASEELKEIIDNLEEALVQYKSGKDLAKSKATVERYARKAKLYFSNNPKIKPLLAEVEEDMAVSEKRAKSIQRSDSVKSFFTNPWTYGGLFIVLTVLVIAFCIFMAVNADNDDALGGWIFTTIYLGGACVCLTILFIRKVCLK